MSGLEFDALPYEEGRRWELLHGELIPMPSPTLEHQEIVQNVQVALVIHIKAHPGRALACAGVEFALDKDSRVRPDVLVLLEARVASIDRQKVPIPGAPDIAVEVISPSERSADTQQKLAAYLWLGTREVWQIYPKSKSVVIHCGGTSATLGAGDRLVTPLLDGFSLAVESLF